MGIERILDYVIQFIQIFWFWRVIPKNKRGVKLRFGKNPKVMEPGFHLVWPFEIDNVTTCIVEPEFGSSYPIHITTADFKTITVTPTTKYRINDPVAWLYAENDAATNLYEAMRLATVEILTDCNWDECLKRTTLTQIKNKIKSKTENIGIEIIDFGLTNIALSKLIITKV